MPLISERLGKILYGLLFIPLLPVVLVEWAHFGAKNISLPIPYSTEIGLTLALISAVIMVSGTIALRVHGHGLPMNPYPPTRFVSRGMYHLIAHPIYVGFSGLCLGTSLAMQSSCGVWLVSPVVMLGCFALVQGYEKQDLAQRFGRALPKPLISLPSHQEDAPGKWDRISVYLLVLLPWLVLYEAVKTLDAPKDAVSLFLPFENGLPVWAWTEAIYASAYILVFAVPLVAGSKRALREFSIA
jgi:protein-S-isoprenylcysteine O-methyltransferase Ste14